MGKDVVEARRGDLEVADVNAGTGEVGDQLAGGVGVAGTEGDGDVVGADGSLDVGRPGQPVDVGGRDRGGDDLAADEPLQFGRCAAGGNPAVVEHDDLVGEPVGLVEVL